MKLAGYSIQGLMSAALAAIILSSCSLFDSGADTPLPDEPLLIQLTPVAEATITRSNAFGVDLFRKVVQDDAGENLMLSPFSASAALTMVLNGADGETFDEIRAMLGHDTSDLAEINQSYRDLVKQLINADPSVQLHIGNGMFHDRTFSPKTEYVRTLREDFESDIRELDFGNPESVDVINQWASDQTNTRVPKVLNNIRPDAVMFLLNALYFKGDWTEQFKRSDTRDEPFTLGDGNQVTVPMMSGNLSARYTFDSGFMAAELPYGRKNFSMVVIVPSEGIEDFIETFDGAAWEGITGQLDGQTDWTKMQISMPRFTFEYEKYLNDQLKALGMEQAFDHRADFSRITDEGILVDFVKQNTFVEVNEEGTEAAAVTTVGFIRTSVPPSLRADKPFIFAIRERTSNTLLFIGAVHDPS